MEYLFDLLKMKPVLSIILGFVLAIFILIFFKDLIISYIKKKYDLYSESEIRSAFREYYYEDVASELFDDESFAAENKIMRYLKNE